MPSYDPQKIRDYLREIGAGDPVTTRVFDLISDYEALIGYNPEFIFVENTINDEGLSNFSNLALFRGDTYADYYINQPNSPFAITNVSRAIDSLTFSVRQDTDFRQIGERAVMSVEVVSLNTRSFHLHAAGRRNCNELLTLVKSYLLPTVTGE